MSAKEIKRRDLTGITSSSTILSAMSTLQISQSKSYIHPGEMMGLMGPLQDFTVEVTSPYFKTDSSLCIPLSDATMSGNNEIKHAL